MENQNKVLARFVMMRASFLYSIVLWFDFGADPGRKERLQQFDLVGSQLSKICVSKEFETFVSVDDVGIPYILQEIPIHGQI